MLRLGHVFVFFLWICILILVVVAGQSSTDDLPFHVIAACPPAPAATTNSTDTGNSSRTTDNQHNTALLFFQSSALTSSSLCQCDLHSTGQFHVSKLWSEGNISTPVNCSSTDGSPDDGVRECDWGEDNKITGTPADVVKVQMQRRDGGEEGSPSYVVLLVRGESSVNIDCRKKEEEVATNSSSTVAVPTEATTSNTTTTTTTTINTSASETASASDASSSLQTTLAMTTPGAAGKTRTIQVTPEEESSVPTFPSSEQAKGPSDGQEEEKEEEDEDDDDDSLSFIILGLGVGLACLAIVAIGITVCCVSKKLKRRRHSDAESALVRQQSTKSCANNDCGANDDYEITEGDTKENASTTALHGSRASLLSEKHNYEDVTVDMVPPTVAPKPAPRKASNQSLPPPSNYSRIHPAGKRNVRGTTSLPPNTKAPSSDADVPEVDKDEDDYSELDLAHSTRQPSVTLSPTSLPVTVLRIGAVNDDYMDVGEGEDDVEPEDPADIYEAVDDGDEEKTPLYGGRSRSRNDYTDCMSGSTGKIHLCTGEVNKGFDGPGPDAGEPEQPPSQPRPSLPTSPPPKAGVAGKPPGISRSLDDMAPGTDEQEENTPAPPQRPTHRHSKSEDLTSNMSRCQQRDLFLERFRSQGDGAEADQMDSGDQQAQENDYTEVPSTAPNADIPNPSTQPRDNQADSPEKTARKSSPDKIVMRRKSRNSKAMNGGKAAGPVSMADHLKKLNTGLLELETAVRHSMEIQEDELIMIDNVLYGTLPRNNSLPTTEL